MSKYHARRTILQNVVFDSQAEALRWMELQALEQAGEITALVRQPRYVLQEPFTDSDGKRQRAITYVGDFAYVQDGRQVCEDVKGLYLPVFLLKAKLFRRRYPNIELRLTGGGRK